MFLLHRGARGMHSCMQMHVWLCRSGGGASGRAEAVQRCKLACMRLCCVRLQVVVRVRPVLPNESVDDVAVTCSGDGTKVQVLLPDKGGNGKDMLPGASRSGARSYSFDACLPGKNRRQSSCKMLLLCLG